MQFQDDDLDDPIYPTEDPWLKGWFISLKGNSCKEIDEDDIVTVFYRLRHYTAVYHDQFSRKYQTKREAQIAAKSLVERVQRIERGKPKPKPDKPPEIDWSKFDMSDPDAL